MRRLVAALFIHRQFMQASQRTLALSYVRLYALINARFGVRLHGLGFTLRCVKIPFVFSTSGCQFYFSPDCAAAYGILPVGYWNERETHRFFEVLLSHVAFPFHFIDLGASVREMVLGVARRAGVVCAYAFEPQRACAEVIRRPAMLNGLQNIEVRCLGVPEKSGRLALESSRRSPTSAKLGSLWYAPCKTLLKNGSPT